MKRGIVERLASTLKSVKDRLRLAAPRIRNLFDRRYGARITEARGTVDNEISELKQEMSSLKEAVDLILAEVEALREEVPRIETARKEQRVEERPQLVSAPLEPQQTVILLKARSGTVQRLFKRSRAVVNNVIVVQDPVGNVRVLFRPSNANAAAEVVRRLREAGANVMGAEVIVKVRRTLPGKHRCR